MRIITLLLFSLLVISCTSTKSTIKNIDNTAIKPKIINDAFEITEYANDSKYGYDADYPINIGPISEKLEDINIKYFFNSLEGENGEIITYNKTDTCCPFPTETNSMGAGTLVIYEVSFSKNNKKATLYFNTFERGKIVCPKGFAIKKRSK